MSTLAKLGIVALVIIFVGGAAAVVGVYYVVHRVTQKYHEVSDKILASSSDSRSSSPPGASSGSANSGPGRGSQGNVCRFLSKEDVSRAIGVEIVRTQPDDNSCAYIARGSQTDMMAKHATAIAASRGADKQSQEMFQKFAGGIFKAFESKTPASEQASSDEVPVFSFSLDQEAAEQQMRLNAKILGNMGSQNGLPGIGDQAFVTADGIIMIRKGKTLVRVVYVACPCGTEAVMPLAKTLADRL